jgi:hypothetical protein
MPRRTERCIHENDLEGASRCKALRLGCREARVLPLMSYSFGAHQNSLRAINGCTNESARLVTPNHKAGASRERAKAS